MLQSVRLDLSLFGKFTLEDNIIPTLRSIDERCNTLYIDLFSF